MNGQPMNVNIDQDKIDAKFCDQILMHSGAFGFTFDFIQQIPQIKASRILSRIGMSPQHAKIFSELLGKGIQQYEGTFGEIQLTSKMKDEANKQIGFRPDSHELIKE